MPSTLHSSDYRAFVLRLIEVRRTVGVSQAELASRLGRPQSYVAKNEKFQRRVDPAEFWSIMRALGRDPVGEYAIVTSALDSTNSAVERR
jgi:transcriptional regulator with XRE-family HTH domain